MAPAWTFASSTRTTSLLGVWCSGVRRAVTTGTSVTTTPGSESEAQLEAERRSAGRGKQRRAPELLGNDDRDEVGLSARQAPDLLEERLHPSFVDRQCLEPRLLLRELPPARADARVGVTARREQRTDRLAARDAPRVPERTLRRDVDRLDPEKHLVLGIAGEPDRVDARLEPPAEAAVVAVDAEEHEHEERNRDDHQPRTLGELGPDDDHA